jgi:hypothetical protein
MAISNMFSSRKYHSVRSSISEDVGFELNLSWTLRLESEKCQDNSHESTNLRLLAPWIASTVFFAILAAYLGFRVLSIQQNPI